MGDGVSFKHPGGAVHIGQRLRRVELLDDEGAFCVPSHHHLFMATVPHHRYRIEPAVQRSAVIDPALARGWIEGRTDKSFAMRHQADLCAGMVREGVRRDPCGNRRLDLLPSEVRTQDALGLRKTAADIAGSADRAGHDLFDDYRKLSYNRFHVQYSTVAVLSIPVALCCSGPHARRFIALTSA